jgi:hypothetical protein
VKGENLSDEGKGENLSEGEIAGPNVGSLALGRLSFAMQTSRSARVDLTYLERGNVLVGTRSGGAVYALVGVDSALVSLAYLKPPSNR